MDQLCQKIHFQSSIWLQVMLYSFGPSQSLQKKSEGQHHATLLSSALLTDSDKMHPDSMLQNKCSSKYYKERKIDFRGLFLFRASRRCNMLASLEKPLQYMCTIRASCSLKILLNKNSFPACKQSDPTLVIHSALQIH